MTDIHTAMGALHPGELHRGDSVSPCVVCRQMAATPQCGARVGYVAGEWQETPVWCATTVGLTEYQDVHGVTRWYCRHHEKVVKFRYPRAKPLDACWFCMRTAPVIDGRYVLMTLDDGRLRVCCDDCYVKADEPDDEDEPEWTNREGQPEFNGSFR